MKKLILTAITALLLTGCNNIVKEETFVCTATDGTYVLEETLLGINDALVTSTIVTSFDFSDLADNGLTPEDYDATLEEITTLFKEVDSVDFESQKSETGYTETMLIKYDKKGFSELYELGFLDTADADYVSLSDSVKTNEAKNMTCVAK